MQVDLVTGIDFRLAIERKVITILADQNMSQQTWARTPAGDRARGQFGLGERLATGAGHARPHDAFYHEVAGDVFQLFCHVLTKLLECATAIAAGITR